MAAKAKAAMIAEAKKIHDKLEISHNDLNAGNVFFNEDVTSSELIDWGAAKKSSVVSDNISRYGPRVDYSELILLSFSWIPARRSTLRTCAMLLLGLLPEVLLLKVVPRLRFPAGGRRKPSRLPPPA